MTFCKASIQLILFSALYCHSSIAGGLDAKTMDVFVKRDGPLSVKVGSLFATPMNEETIVKLYDLIQQNGGSSQLALTCTVRGAAVRTKNISADSDSFSNYLLFSIENCGPKKPM